jgi:hypothetical protein
MDRSEEDSAAQRIVDLLIGRLKEPDGRVRVEDLISAAAAVVGERCIETAGILDPRSHEFAPGSRVFSDTVNDLLCGNVSTKLEDFSPDTVFGRLRDDLTSQDFSASEFPDVENVFRTFASGVGRPEEWGWVPLSVDHDNRPFLMPLRIAYETRTVIDEICTGLKADHRRCLRIATRALAEVLIAVRQAIAPSVALLLAFETVNGMSKTAPMTPKAFSLMAKEVVPPRAPTRKPWWRFW